MSVPTYYVCPHLLCLSPPIVSVPILTSLKNILIWPTQLRFRVWHSQLSLFLSKMLDVRKDATRKGGVTVTIVDRSSALLAVQLYLWTVWSYIRVFKEPLRQKRLL